MLRYISKAFLALILKSDLDVLLVVLAIKYIILLNFIGILCNCPYSCVAVN